MLVCRKEYGCKGAAQCKVTFISSWLRSQDLSPDWLRGLRPDYTVTNLKFIAALGYDR